MDIPAPNPLSNLPSVRNGIIIGPDGFSRGRITCFAKDCDAGLYFRLGQREAVLLRGLQRKIGFEDLATSYHKAFGRRLSAASLEKAIEVFSRAGLIEGTEDQASNSKMDCTISGASPTLFSLKIIRWDPNIYLSKIIPLWRWLGKPTTLVIVAALGVLSEIAVVVNFHAVFSVAKLMSSHETVARLFVLVAVNSIMLVLHEGAHALVCKSYGGEVHEMGFQIRYLLFTPYTRLDDVLLLGKRWQRAAVFMAGPLTSLMALPVALACWWATTPNTLAHETAADMLIWYNLLCLIQLVPFLQLDGYFVLSQMLNMPELRQDSFSYFYRGVLSLVGLRSRVRLSSDLAGYLGPIYLTYGVLSFLTTTGLLISIIVKNATRLSEWVGPIASYSIVSIIIGLLLGRFIWQMRAYNGHATW